MKSSYFRRNPFLLVLIGLLMTCSSVFADDPNVWGRWGSGGDVYAVVDVGGSLEIGEISDPSLFNPGLNNLNLPGAPGGEPANPGDWVMYSGIFVDIFEFEGEGPGGPPVLLFEDECCGDFLVAVTEGTLLLRPPATEGADGQLGFNINRFIDADPFSSTGGEDVLFPLAVLAEEVDFPDAPEFVPFFGEGPAVANVPGFVEGGGGIEGFEVDREGEIDFLAGGFYGFFLEIEEGPGGFNGEIFGEGLFFAGQPTADISSLQAGNVIAQYNGFSGLGFDVFVTMNFQPATFTAQFDDAESFDLFGSFEVAGTINGSSFTSSTFVPGSEGEFFDITDAEVNGTLFGPNAEALGGIVTYDATDGEETFSGADVFVAGQEGVPLPRVDIPVFED